ncbi:MAG TPA: PEP-CTERM sorting domain-containing protein [Rhizomicrobium sp.]|jgi:hypothetical protein|nr:PEP-CTERM sorting domain-containing protein [Rhizomicrobium sp.]
MADGPTWTAGPNTFGFPTWTVPLSNNEFPEFNAAGISNGAGNFATEVDFFYTGTQPNSFNTDFDTGFTHVNTPEGQVWDTDFVSSDEVIFKAVNGDKLVPGSLYSMLVGFINPIDPSGFSFRVVFTDGSQTSDVPEPSSLALFGAGLVMLAGFMFRRRSTLS